MTVPSKTLNDGNTIPAIGFGTNKLGGEEGVAAMSSALETGYRLLDTALAYDNEREVGEAVRNSGIPRDEIFVTTKLPGRFHGADATLAGFEQSLANLQLDYIDLYLIHWPVQHFDEQVESFKAMIRLREQGVIRSVGVSNFSAEHLQHVMNETGVVPAVNQVELHPHFPQQDLRAFHDEHGIVTQSWTPLAGQLSPITDERVKAVADAHGVTPSQAVLRWHVQLGAVPIPKSSRRGRQQENFDIFGFELTPEEIASISSLESGPLWDGDPNKRRRP